MPVLRHNSDSSSYIVSYRISGIKCKLNASSNRPTDIRHSASFSANQWAQSVVDWAENDATSVYERLLIIWRLPSNIWSEQLDTFQYKITEGELLQYSSSIWLKFGVQHLQCQSWNLSGHFFSRRQAVESVTRNDSLHCQTHDLMPQLVRSQVRTDGSHPQILKMGVVRWNSSSLKRSYETQRMARSLKADSFVY